MNCFLFVAASWFISPLLSGLASTVIFALIRHFILSKIDAFDIGLKSLPLFYTVKKLIAINIFSVFYKRSHVLGFDGIPLYEVLILSIRGGILPAIRVLLLCPHTWRRKFWEKYIWWWKRKNPLCWFTNCCPFLKVTKKTKY